MRDSSHKAKLLFDRANKLSNRKKEIKLLTKAIKLDDKYSDAYALRSICFSMEGKHSEAQLDLDKATALSSSSIATKFAKTTYLFSSKQYKQAIEASTQVINKVIREQILDKQDSPPRIGEFKFAEEDLAYCYFFRALSALHLKHYNSAVEDFNVTLNLKASDEIKKQASYFRQNVLRKLELEKEKRRKSKLSYKACKLLGMILYIPTFVLCCVAGLATAVSILGSIFLSLGFIHPLVSGVACFLLFLLSPALLSGLVRRNYKGYYDVFYLMLFFLSFYALICFGRSFAVQISIAEGLLIIVRLLIVGIVGAILTYFLFYLSQFFATKANGN